MMMTEKYPSPKMHTGQILIAVMNRRREMSKSNTGPEPQICKIDTLQYSISQEQDVEF